MNFLLKYLLKRNGLVAYPKSQMTVPEYGRRMTSPGGYPIIEAFEMDGVKYYQFEDPFNIPTARFLASYTAYEELQMRCDADYLDKHTRACTKILSQKQINLEVLGQINVNLRERLELMPMPDFIFKLAAIVFFDENEAPTVCDVKYNEAKIARWKQNPDALAFFLSGPIKNLIPSLNIATEHSRTYSDLAERIDKIHRGVLTKVLSEGWSGIDKTK